MSDNVQFAAIAPRLELAFLEQNEPGGLPVVFLHGYSDTARSWLPLMAELPQSFRLIAVTQRGHGDSSKPAEGYDTRRYAADLAAFLDDCGLERAFVVGHSFGTLVAQRFALDYPERVLGLALLGAFPTLAGKPEIEELAAAVMELDDPVDPAFVRDFQQSTLARPIPVERLQDVISESLKMPARVWKALTRQLLEDDFSTELAQINAPALIVWGEHDGLTNAGEQRRLAALLPGSTLVPVADAGHAMHWEDPAAIAALLAPFFRAHFRETA